MSIEGALSTAEFKHRNDAFNQQIHELEGQLICSIKNSRFPKSDSDRSGSGIGLSNLTRRLDMIYPGRYILEYGPAGETDYRALLCIKFDEP